MDQFSHDLTLALEETSLMDRACGVGRWGSRRRTRSTGNLPCAPQPTEDSSSSPTDTANAHGHGHGHSHGHSHGHGHGHVHGHGQHHHHHHHHQHPSANVDGLDLKLAASDSDDKAGAMLPLRLPVKTLNAAAAVRMGAGALESDSLNETNFSPARFYKPNSRRKRKIKRMSMEFEFSKDSHPGASPHSCTESPLQPGMLGGGGGACSGLALASTGTIRKRLLKADAGNRSNFFFCGKRKRSNRDRYHEQEPGTGSGIGCSSKLHSSSVPRYTHMEEYQRMRPRSYSSTSKPHSDRLLPLNKGLLSKINRMAQQTQKTDNADDDADDDDTPKTGQSTQELQQLEELEELSKSKSSTGRGERQSAPQPAVDPAASVLTVTDILGSFSMDTIVPVTDIESLLSTPDKVPQVPQMPRQQKSNSASKAHRRRRFCQTPQPLQAQSMDISELYDFLSSSSLSSSSDSEDGGHRRHDTGREGDDELTDWPGNEFGPGGKYDPKRKLTKKSLLSQIRSDDTIGEDDTLMSGTETTVAAESAPQTQTPWLTDALQELSRFQPAPASEPIEIQGGASGYRHATASFIDVNHCLDMDINVDTVPAVKQIESEMSGETSNPFLSSSPPGQVQEVREIRAGCRRINGDRPGFSIKLSVNERLARFLQDPRQTQIRLPDMEISESDSLYNLANLYSLTMVVEHGCTVLTKTGNTTQSVSVEHPQQRGLPQHPDLFGDFKRRCYGDGEGDGERENEAKELDNK
ncbi:uncharacterized protein LOC117903750 [Drosophila subobscura]|uniref:uncharacterized protein LOC117903750 n=1 Tax=Drosophila subobscura TaxID=7241 RepID=UPI00155B3843|nr:uncharacterized protein LOC117903750 [Drosophila subobscura]